jgi:UDP-N-acetylmuramoyl-L-alanyl-D-glutamate--2,6-diaminopimelate ligase
MKHRESITAPWRVGTLAAEFGGRVLGDPATVVRDVVLDSRCATYESLFAALVGLRSRGALHARDAVTRGATSVLVAHERDVADLPQLSAPNGLAAVWVHPAPQDLVGRVAARVFDDPTLALDVAAVTGTNGKTTVAHVTGQLLERGGRRVAVLGTAGHRLAGQRGSVHVDASHTTPDAPELQRLLARHRAAGGDAVVMEASSHALAQDRLSGTRVRVAAFTNLTREHLDYHGTLERYARAKARLFTELGPDGYAVLNRDDRAWETMASAATARGARVVTTSTRSRADLAAARLRTDRRGAQLQLTGMGISEEVEIPLRGRHNVENALTAAAIARLMGVSPAAVVEGLVTATAAPGRLEPVGDGAHGFDVLVDYAHSPDALERVLSTLREDLAADGKGGRLVVVFGCGGDRDRGKRPEMGAIAARLADVAVVTSDNPRSENPRAIIDEILVGFDHAGGRRLVEVDRRGALERAFEVARPGDIVLIAGKGHENTQTIGAEVLPFDDRVEALELLGAARTPMGAVSLSGAVSLTGAVSLFGGGRV